jgi:hypothetical protein
MCPTWPNPSDLHKCVLPDICSCLIHHACLVVCLSSVRIPKNLQCKRDKKLYLARTSFSIRVCVCVNHVFARVSSLHVCIHTRTWITSPSHSVHARAIKTRYVPITTAWLIVLCYNLMKLTTRQSAPHPWWHVPITQAYGFSFLPASRQLCWPMSKPSGSIVPLWNLSPISEHASKH